MTSKVNLVYCGNMTRILWLMIWSIFAVLYNEVTGQCALGDFKSYSKVLNVTYGAIPPQVPLINSTDFWCGNKNSGPGVESMVIDIGRVVLLQQIKFQGKPSAGGDFPSKIKAFAGTDLNNLQCLNMNSTCKRIDTIVAPPGFSPPGFSPPGAPPPGTADDVSVFNLSTPLNARYIKYQLEEGYGTDFKFCLRVEAQGCPIDDCSSKPCMNGGTCNSQLGKEGYNCTCVAGYGGKNCSNNINECASTPCKNKGNCTDLINDYSCTCYSQFQGRNCTRVCTATQRELGVSVSHDQNAESYLRIPDESVTSSSVLTQDGVTYGAYRGRVGQKRAGPYGDAWCAATAGQYIQVQLDLATPIEKIVTRGSKELDSWVSQFYITYSKDSGSTYKEYKGLGSTRVEFSGNFDSSTAKDNDVYIFSATNIRVHPTGKGGPHYCMQIAIYGCPRADVAPVPLGTVAPAPQAVKPTDPSSPFFAEANQIYVLPMVVFVFLFFLAFLLWLITSLCRRHWSNENRKELEKQKIVEDLEAFRNSIAFGPEAEPYMRKREIQTVVMEMGREPEWYEVDDEDYMPAKESEVFRDSNKIFTFGREYVKYE